MPDIRLGGGERLNPYSTQMFAWARELTCKMGFEVFVAHGRKMMYLEMEKGWKAYGNEKWGRAGMGKFLLARPAGSASYTECLLKGWCRP